MFIEITAYSKPTLLENRSMPLFYKQAIGLAYNMLQVDELSLGLQYYKS